MRLFLALFFSFTLYHASAHVDNTFHKVLLTKVNVPSTLHDSANEVVFRKNIIKLNLASLLFSNNSLSYERSISQKITLVAGYRYMPAIRTTNTYAGRKIYDFLEKNDQQQLASKLHSTYLGNHTFTGELRFYTGKHPGARGFYVSIYGRYMNFNIAYPYKHEIESRSYTIPFNGNVTAFAGGFMIGAQWLIAKRVTLDWYILGSDIGILKIDMPGKTDLSNLTSDEKRQLKEELEVGDGGIDSNIKVKATVSDDGVLLGGNLPYLGFRGFGLSLGFAF